RALWRGFELTGLLAALLDPAPEEQLDGDAIHGAKNELFQRLRTSRELASDVADLWRLRSRFGADATQGVDSIRALREPQGLRALSLQGAWALRLGRVASDLDRLGSWFRSLPRERVHPDFLPSGGELVAAGFQPGPGLGRVLEAVENAALEGSVTDARSAAEWIQARRDEFLD
ncbi:MAG: hypothetical protein KDB61_07455, partial [Planctomycetes bacterium]|nr:hypothetical protein [Planctomycetota bacterium]